MTKEEIFEKCLESKNGVILQEKNFKKNFEDVYTDMNSFVKEPDLPFVQKLYNYFHNLEYSPRTSCGKTKTFRNFRHGYNDFCSSNCECMIRYSNTKREETSMSKYGVSNPNKLESAKRHLSEVKSNYSADKKKDIADKKRTTLKEKYGDGFGKIISNGVMKKYGVVNVSQIPEIREKMKNSNIERYGGIGFASLELRSKYKATNARIHGNENYNNKEKREQTCLEKYGEISYFKTDEFKEQYKRICIEKYGTDNASKSEIVKEKISVKNKKLTNDKTMTKHKDIIEIRDASFIVRCSDDCECGGNFEIPKHVYFQRLKYGTCLCTVKNPVNNKTELENTFIDYIHNIYDGEIVIHNRKILSGKEIDVYLPELKIGFEFNGDYWHANPIFYKMNDNNEFIGSHYEKWNTDMNKKHEAYELGICLYDIWEYAWLEFNEETKNRIKHIIKNNIHEKYAYSELKHFLDFTNKNYSENVFGIFEFDNVIVRYAENFYCNKNAIDKSWFTNSDKRVIYVYDFEINDNRKFEIVKSLICHALGLTENKIYARKCFLKEITNKEAKPFLTENSLFGHRNAKITLGLYYEDELVMIYSFGHNFYGKNKHIEVIRVCTKKDTVVVGGSSKCLSYFKEKYKDDFMKYGLTFYVDKIHQDGKSLKDFKFIRHEYGAMNCWNIDYDDGELSGNKGTTFNRMPTKHKKIKELESKHILTCILTAGVDVYEHK